MTSDGTPGLLFPHFNGLFLKMEVRPQPKTLQGAFLNRLRKNKVPLTLFLKTGLRLQGVVTGFDNLWLQLRHDGQSQLVHKHSVATVMPTHSIKLVKAEVE